MTCWRCSVFHTNKSAKSVSRSCAVYFVFIYFGLMVYALVILKTGWEHWEEEEPYMKHVRLRTLYLQNLQNEIGTYFLIQRFISDCWYFQRVSDGICAAKLGKWQFSLQFILIQGSACASVVAHFIWPRWVFPSCPSGSAAALRRQVDERVACLSQLADGHPPSLPDELSHRVQLCWSNEDKLPSVIDHTCRKHIRERQTRGNSFIFNFHLGNNE